MNTPTDNPNKLDSTEVQVTVAFSIIAALLFGGLCSLLAFGLTLLFSESLFRAVGLSLIILPAVTFLSIRRIFKWLVVEYKKAKQQEQT